MLAYSYLCTVKQLLIIFVSLMLLTTTIGCGRQQVINRVLDEAGEIIEQNPDSAYTLLQTIDDIVDNGDESSIAHYIVLLTEASYKKYLETPNDSQLIQAINYYQQEDDRPMLCQAYYYRAMILYEQGEHDQALLLLKEGEELASQLNDVLLMSKYHESLCMVNDRANCHELMLKYAKLFLTDALKLNDTTMISRGLSEVAVAYLRLGQKENGHEIILQTLPHLNKLKESSRSYILTNIACTYHHAGDLELAERYLKLSLKTSAMPNTYAELGDVYADEGNITEAEKCWNKALESGSSRIRLNTLTSVFKQYKKHSDHSKALGVLEQIHHLKDSMNDASEKEAIWEIQQKYEKQSIENKYYKAQTWIWRGVFITFALIVIILYFYRRSVKAYTTKLNESYQTIQNIQQHIIRLEKERDQQLLEINTEKELRNKEVEIINQKYDKKIETLKAKVVDIQREAFERIGHGREIYRAVLRNIPIRYRDDEKCLIEYYSVFHYESYHRWMEEYDSLSVRYLVILILQEMGKKDAEIEQLLFVSNGALRTARSRLNNKKKDKKSS